MAQIVLIDLSYLFRRNWHATAHKPVNEALKLTVADVHRWAREGDHVAVCIDSPPYLRKEMYPGYKAQREEPPKQMYGLLDATIERLRRDGFLVVGARGHEADDVIATFAAALHEEHVVMMVTADKDAYQCVRGGRVVAVRPDTGEIFDAAGVEKKLGVPPSKVVDWLALVGDSSDNIPGVKGIGPKGAAELLQRYGDLATIYERLGELSEKKAAALEEARAIVRTAYALIRLREDAPIDIAAIFEPREYKPLEDHSEDNEPPPTEEQPMQDMKEPEIIDAKQAPEQEPEEGQALAKVRGKTSFELALEPRDLRQAHWVAKVLYQARLFGDYPNVEAVLGTIMTGRCYGLDAVTSLRSFHNIKGKQTMSATLMVGIVKKRTDLCRYFRLVESTDKHAVYETHRAGEPEPTRMTYTIEQAKRAGLLGKGGNWDARPETMLRHRCATELARAVYPDLVAGLYSTDEMEDAA